MSAIEVLQSSSFTVLADALLDDVYARRQRNPQFILRPISVIVAHPSLLDVLRNRSVERFGIFAGFDLVLLSEWLARQAQDLERELLQPAQLRWQLFLQQSALSQPNGEGAQSDLFALCKRMAENYFDYFLYRSDWFDEALNLSPEARAGFHQRDQQLAHFCALQTPQTVSWTTRVQLLHELSERLIRVDEWSDLHFFGFNHLPPTWLEAVEKIATRGITAPAIKIYFANPCRHYWADVVREGLLLNRTLRAAHDAQLSLEHFEVGHPLLANWGVHGQRFFAELARITDNFTHLDSVPNQAAVHSLLQAVQHSVMELSDLQAPAERDDSIVLRSSPTRLQEVLALRDFIAARMQLDASLALHEVLVLMPAVDDYRAAITSVFDAHHYSVAAERVELPRLMERLLTLSDARFSVADVMEIAELEEVAAQFQWDAHELDLLRALLNRAHISFGLHGSHLAQILDYAHDVGVRLDRDDELHTWRAGLQRMAFGFLHGASDDQQCKGLFGVAGVDVSRAASLSRLLQLLRQLARVLSESRASSRTLADWCIWWRRQLEFFVLDAWLRIENSAWPNVLACLQGIGELSSASVAPEVDFDCFVEIFRTHWSEQSVDTNDRKQGSSGSSGGIRFRSLAATRATPARIIAVLGLNDGEFPKHSLPDALNWIYRENTRANDRNFADEDRYLLLEALMSAGENLWLSCAGEAGEAAVPSPLLLEFARFLAPTIGIVTTAPSIASLIAQNHGKHAERELPASPAPGQQNSHSPCTMRDFLNYWRNPIRAFVRQHLHAAVPDHLQPNGQDDHLDPLQLSPDPLQRVQQRLLSAALSRAQAFETNDAPVWLRASGELASGLLGEQALADVIDGHRLRFFAVQLKLQAFALASNAELLALINQQCWLDVDLHSEGNSMRVRGFLRGVQLRAESATLWKLETNRTAPGKRFLWKIEAALLMIQKPELLRVDLRRVGSEDGIDEGGGIIEREQCLSWFAKLLSLRQAAINAAKPLWFSPYLSLALPSDTRDVEALHASCLNTLRAFPWQFDSASFALAASALEAREQQPVSDPDSFFFAQKSAAFQRFIDVAEQLREGL